MTREKSKNPKTGRSGPSNRVLVAMKLISEMRYGQARVALMEQFGIARTTATNDLTEATRLLGEELETQKPYLAGVLVNRLLRVMDRAEAKGKDIAAVRAAEAVAKIAGLIVNEHGTNINVIGGNNVSIEQLAHVKVLQMTQPQRMHREQELAAREAALLGASSEPSEPSEGDGN